MKKFKKVMALILATLMTGSCLAGMIIPSSGITASEEREVLNMDSSVYVLSDIRNRVSFNDGWKFIKKNVSNAQRVNFDDSNWSTVSLPHSWTQEDYNAHPKYYQGEAWYRKTFEVDAKAEYLNNGKRLWVEFEACGKYAKVYINGQPLGEHFGGYSAFRFDITDHLTDTGTNVIAILADNSGHGQTISPLSMDFDNWGGLYRDSWLIETSSVGVDMSNSGSSGFFLSAEKDENSDNWAFNVSSKVVNTTGKKVTAQAEIILRYPKRADLTWMDMSYDISSTAAYEIGSEENPFLFDPDKMYETFENDDDYIVEKRTVSLTIGANGEESVDEDFTVVDPKLWNGVYSPYRYVAEINIKVDGETVDHVKDFYGFRYYHIDPETGFYLNGEPYRLKGANKHQDFGLDENGDIIGACTSGRELYVDLCIAYEMGANYLRLAHYPHDKAFYDLCDAYGICVSGELAFGGYIGGKTTYDLNDPVTVKFFENTKLQMTELVKQQHNNPSIIIWGLTNEIVIRDGYYEVIDHYMTQINDLAHELDGNNRYTSYTVCEDKQLGFDSDLIAWNIYPQWYFNYTFEERATELYNAFKTEEVYEKYLAIAVTEYGAGANPFHHTSELSRPSTGGDWHPEEWASYVHEDAVLDIENIDYLWVTSPWQLFDCASAGRNEGDTPGINNKGLVNYDRTIKKDGFYIYKANYSEIPFVQIAESRHTPRRDDEITVKCYSNEDSVTLYKMQNGEKVLIGEMESRGAGIFVSNVLPFDFGSNVFVAEVTKDGKTYSNTCDFVNRGDQVDFPEKAYDISPSDITTINAVSDGLWFENSLESSNHAAPLHAENCTAGGKILKELRYGDVITFKINIKEAGTYDLNFGFIWSGTVKFDVSIDGGNPVAVSGKGGDWSSVVTGEIGQYELTAGEHTVQFTSSNPSGGCHFYSLILTAPGAETPVEPVFMNYAIGCPVTTYLNDCYTGFGNAVANINDGKYNTQFSSTQFVADPQAGDSFDWIMIDLGSEQTINRVIFTPTYDGSMARYYMFPTDYEVQVSTDNEEWQTVGKKTNYTCEEDKVVHDFDDVNARYVRIYVTGFQNSVHNPPKWFVYLKEFEIGYLLDSETTNPDEETTVPDVGETTAPDSETTSPNTDETTTPDVGETTAPDTVEETTASVGETTVTPNGETTVTPEVETTESPEGNATDAPQEGTAKVDASADDTTTAEASGCKASVGAATATTALIAAAGAVVLKKKED